MASPLPVRWTERAVADLRRIREHIALDRPLAAERMDERLHRAGERLGEFPLKGRTFGHSRELVAVRPYVMRYRVAADAVVIVRVKHGAQRL